MFSKIRSAPILTSPGSKSQASRLRVLAFVADPSSEAILSNGFRDFIGDGLQIKRGSMKNAIAHMSRYPAPDVLIVDIVNDSNPLQMIFDLCDIIEPSTSLIILGDTDNIDFYKKVRQTGATDYLFKPLTQEMVARQLLPYLKLKSAPSEVSRGGRVITVTGARGGVGASTLAASLAWHLGVLGNHYTILLDWDIYFPPQAKIFQSKGGANLCSILRQDDLESYMKENEISEPIMDRLFMLTGYYGHVPEESYAPGSIKTMLDYLKLKYNFVIVDLPLLITRSRAEVLEAAHHQLLVLQPTLLNLRETTRLLNASNPQRPGSRPSLILNRHNLSGALGRRQIEAALKRKMDFTIPDLPKFSRKLGDAEAFSDLAQTPFGLEVANLVQELGFSSRASRNQIKKGRV